MAEFESCMNCKHVTKKETDFPCNECKHGVNVKDHYKPRSNADRIRSMSDEELAENNVREIFHDRWHCSDWSYFSKKENAIQHELEWLKSEAKE